MKKFILRILFCALLCSYTYGQKPELPMQPVHLDLIADAAENGSPQALMDVMMILRDYQDFDDITFHGSAAKISSKGINKFAVKNQSFNDGDPGLILYPLSPTGKIEGTMCVFTKEPLMLRTTYTYSNGMKNGVGKYYNIIGDLSKEEYWKNDTLIIPKEDLMNYVWQLPQQDINHITVWMKEILSDFTGNEMSIINDQMSMVLRQDGSTSMQIEYRGEIYQLSNGARLLIKKDPVTEKIIGKKITLEFDMPGYEYSALIQKIDANGNSLFELIFTKNKTRGYYNLTTGKRIDKSTLELWNNFVSAKGFDYLKEAVKEAAFKS